MNTDERKEVEINLSLKPEVEELMLDFEKDLIQEDLVNFPAIKEGDVSFQSAYIYDNGENIEVALYILNGLSNKINFEKVPFVILDSEDNMIASQLFDLQQIGIIPDHSARPYKLYFNKESLLGNELPKTGCKIAVGTDIKALKSIDVKLENMPDTIPSIKVKEYEKYIESLPLIRSGEVSMHVYETNLDSEKNIYITLFVRNGSNKQIKVEKLPVTVYDAQGIKIVGGVYDIGNIEVNPHKACIYNFMFTKEEYNAEGLDLSNIVVKFE